MKSRTAKFYSTILMLALVLQGCSKESERPKLPEVNDENCKYENRLKIADKAIQQELTAKCFRRNKFERSPERGW